MLRRSSFWLIVILALFAVACGGDEEAGTDGSTCDPAKAAEPGNYERSHQLGDLEQHYWVVVPSSYDGTAATPLYVLMPGGAGLAEPALVAWGPSLVGLDALVVFPDLAGAGRDDVATIRALVDDVADGYCIDRTRVYATGGSSSAGATARLMANASDVFAAFAVGIGSFGADGRDPVGPVPLLAWAGTTDFVSVERSVAQWAAVNNCDAPVVTDLGSDVAHHHYQGCDAPLEYYYFKGMGHQVPSHECGEIGGYCAEYQEFDFWADAGAFFAANPLDAP